MSKEKFIFKEADKLSGMATDEHDDIFSEDPEEQLRIENEILKLKLRAELGSGMGTIPDIPPEVENAFLKHVLTFAHMHDNAETVSVYELVGSPDFTKYDVLPDRQLPEELERIEQIMAQHSVIVTYGGEYSPRDKYFFITEELFPEKVLYMKMPDMILHFVYEDFHPNHRQSIYDLAVSFIEDWLERAVDGELCEIASSLTGPDGRVYERNDVIQRVCLMFDSFVRFEDATYNVVVVQSDPEGGGLVTGEIRYTAILENGEAIQVAGPVRIHLEYKEPYGWEINYFQWPGFDMG